MNHKLTKIFLILPLLLSPIWCSSWNREALGEVLTAIQKNDSELKIHQLNFDKKNVELSEEKLKKYPELSLNVDYGLHGDFERKLNDQATYFLSLSKNYFDLRKDSQLYKLSQLEVKSLVVENKIKANSVFVDRIETVLNYFLLKEELKLEVLKSQNIGSNLKIFKKQYENGFRDRESYVRLKNSYDHGLIDQKKIQRELLGFESKQKVFLGDSTLNTDFGSFDYPNPISKRISNINADSQSLFQLKSKIERELIQAQKKVSSEKILPEISISAQVGLSNPDYFKKIYRKDQLTWKLMTALSWSSFDFFNYQRRKKIVSIDQQIKEEELYLAIKNSEQFESSLKSSIKNLKELYKLTKKLLKQREESLALVSEQFKSASKSFDSYSIELKDYYEQKISVYRIAVDLFLKELKEYSLSQEIQKGIFK